MKKVVLGSMVLMTLCLTTVLAAGHVFQAAKLPEVVSLTDMTQENVEMLFSRGGEDMILECPAGIELPFSFNLRGDFFKIEEGEEIHHKMKIVKTCYIKCVDDTLFFSTNLVDWQGFEGFFTGSMSAFVGHIDGQKYVGLSIEMNERQ